MLRPQSEHGRYDLVFDLGGCFLRVQCKCGALDRDRDIVCVRIGRSRYTTRGYVANSYDAEEVDASAVYAEISTSRI